jgi:tetratricopeptide (TPR) repeat protein
MRTTVCAAIVVAALSAVALAAQSTYQRRGSTRAVADPVELGGPPKKLLVVSPAKREFFNSPAVKELNSTDPKLVASIVVREVTKFVEQNSNDTDFYLLRATFSCQIPGNDKEAILNDVATSIRLWKQSENNVFASLKNHYVLKAKIEFLLRRYTDAMSDLDAAIRFDYASADQLFNNGNVKADEPPPTECSWARADLTMLSHLFPNDYRTSLYLGLYLSQFAHFSLDTDYQPIIKLFKQAAELKPTSAAPLYFAAVPYVVGGMGGMMSKANFTCIDDVKPRTQACLALDDIRRTGVRLLTSAVAADATFEPAYVLRGVAHYKLCENRQAVRDYTRALELDPKAKVYGDRGRAEVELKDYQPAILDYTKAIAQGCDDSLCQNFESRANVYLKIRDYPRAISDLSRAIRNFLAGTIFRFNIDQFRRIYPEYDAVADDVLCEKLRVLFNPQLSYDVYAKQFLMDADEVDDFVLPELFLKRGDAYADMGEMTRANREYDRVSAGYPKWAENAFTTRNGTRVRIRQ